MSRKTDRSSLTTSIQENSGFDRMLAESLEARILRFERFSIRLFGVANCFVSFGHVGGRPGQGDRSIAAMEAAFSDAFPLSDDIILIADLRESEELSQHRLVVGAPYIRFYASHPVYDTAGNLVACIRLLDYHVREMSDEDTLLFSDLANLMERELAFGALYQAQNELVKQNRQLKRDALIDPLLGTWNKSAIVRSLQIEIERCQKAVRPIALLLVSLDQIVRIRDSYGIVVSDQTLVKMVSRIRSCIRPFDALGRFGGDELLIVLPGASHLVATAVGERIRLAIMMHPETIENEQAALTMSAGAVSTDIFPDAEPELLISLAEKALLSARTAGNNCVVMAKPAQPDMII
ncbi:GGDEF domain-containing protein [Undibacterium sp. SXout7W]|uniref:GGDEF domain-containing protein n=1 Tax=Undibacterium sp. SXout7W TaxID=3413049 RepID=UPI003BF14D85